MSTTTIIQGRFTGGGLFEPKADKIDPGKGAKYSACIVLDPGEDKKIDAIVEAAIEKMWGNKKPPGLQVWGARVGDDPEFSASYERKFINPKVTADKPPQTLVKRQGAYFPTTKAGGIIYPGCYVAVSVEAYPYAGDKAKNVKPGVSLSFQAVLFLTDGDHLDNPFDAEKAFSSVQVPESNNDDFMDIAS